MNTRSLVRLSGGSAARGAALFSPLVSPLVSLVVVASLMSAERICAETLSQEAFAAETHRIEAAYRAELDRCGNLAGNAEDVCRVAADANAKTAKAEAEAAHKGTDEARRIAQILRADGEYAIAKEKCDDVSRDARTACLRDAKGVEVRAKSEARANRGDDDAG